ILEFKPVRNAVVTIGTFDGVHRGHQFILNDMVKKAREMGGETVVVTFYPHPRQVLSTGDNSLRLISTQEEKIKQMDALGIDNLIVIKFTKEFSTLSSEDFIRNYIVEKIKPAALIIGYDHHFGNNRLGDFEMLKELGEKNNFKVERIPVQDVDNVVVSSTKIRNALQIGDIRQANSLLGHQFSNTGIVVHGMGLGRQMGYPTANLEVALEYRLIEKPGVYATFVDFDGKTMPAMTYIGRRPTMNDNRPATIESHLIGFDGDLYGKQLTLRFVDRVRDEKKFNGLDELKRQINIDEQTIINILNKLS
ncbi:MAG: bifunctional riboflavin kinase/FAD synthetase, partial [Bacteroidales bacterium]|nr:bifunctional riboflavin kinase/FAD synthetase [Bacteroidales bacterium]